MQHEPEASGAPRRVSAELTELQGLHDPLLRAYTGISQGTGRLDPARPYLLAHVRESSARLRDAYTAAAQSEERSDVHDWLNRRSDDLASFIKQLDASRGGLGRLFGLAKKGWSATSTIFNVVLLVLTPTVAAATLSTVVLATINKCLCEVFRFSIVVFVLSLIIVGIFGFLWKRQALCKWNPKDPGGGSTEMSYLNVYEAEQQLLRNVDAPRRGEIQWDVITWFLIAAVFVVARYLAPIISSHTEKVFVFLINPWYVVAAFAAFGIIALLRSRRRPWGWRPMI